MRKEVKKSRVILSFSFFFFLFSFRLCANPQKKKIEEGKKTPLPPIILREQNPSILLRETTAR